MDYGAYNSALTNIREHVAMQRVLWAALTFLLSVELSQAQTVTDAELLSRGLQQAAANGDASSISISPNAKTLAFASAATDLVALSGDSNNSPDIFTIEEIEGVLTPRLLVSGVNGSFPDHGAANPKVSPTHPDGKRFAVAFTSTSTNLINGFQSDPSVSLGDQIFVSFPPRGDVVLVSRALGSVPPENVDLKPSNGGCLSPSIAIKGGEPPEIRIAFISTSTNLGSSASNPTGKRLPFLAVMKQRRTDRGWNVTIKGIPTLDTNEDHANLVLSGDGSTVVYDLLRAPSSGQGPSLRQVFRVRDGQSEPELISAYAAGNNIEALEPSVSFNGQVVSFLMRSLSDSQSAAPDLFYVRTGQDFNAPTRANSSNSDVVSNGHILNNDNTGARRSQLAPNGFLIAFADDGTNLIEGDSGLPTFAQTYVKNLLTGQIARTSALATDAVFRGAGNSYGVALGGGFFNSNSITAPFLSEAPNFPGYDANSPKANAYRSVVTFSPPPLTQRAPIDAPPDVRVSSTTATIRLQEFSAAGSSSVEQPAILAGRVRYSVEITNNTTRKRIRLVTTRNRVTVRKLAPGRYTVRYRVSNSSSGSGVIRSKYSPKQTMVIS